MRTIEITLRLPEKLAQDAQESNLLSDEKIAELLQAELDRQAGRLKSLSGFLDKADRLAAAEPKVTPEEIAAEIDEVRRTHSK